MGTKWIDVSMPMKVGMTVWPDDVPFLFSEKSRISKGGASNTSALTMSTHTGTHVDAPWHFEEDGKTIDEIEPSIWFGQALLMEITGADIITSDDLGGAPLPPRVVFKTDNSDISPDSPFQKDFVALDVSAAQRLVEDGVKLVGIDYLSIDTFDQEDHSAHHTLLRNGIVVVEGLRLGGIAPGMYRFITLCLPIKGGDGAPCRAFLGREEE